MMKHLRLLFLLFTAAFLLAACGATEPGEEPVEQKPAEGDFVYGEAMIQSADTAILES